MKNFDEIIAPLLDKKSRIRNINIRDPNKRVYKRNKGNAKPVITPLGKFPSITEAAIAHGIKKNAMFLRVSKKMEGYEYDVEL
jgi:hypothetical protein